ncbi:hypothetical protein B4U79_03167 [Dinothrombium tinctorium]|uniref:Uncharacterized protein n=1 Tax=Dinothrombium tinctorium TaxID=1965070 RepID=A0A3S3SKZ7_9ACAR|nr:hypothetical protein B4U79_03332 [Dinothrombium tinctorium]RWS16637.1 hypothetical protein B4U79_03167 [Dinothrombium tinctorium]
MGGKCLVIVLVTFWWLVIMRCDSYLTRELLNITNNALKARANFTFSNPYYVDPVDRDPRQWLSGAYGYYSPYTYGGYGTGLDAITIGLALAIGVGILGLPILLICLMMFSGSVQSGLNFVPPTTTTTVAGRKKRSSAQSSISDLINPYVQEKLSTVIENFQKAAERMKLFES